MTERQYKDSGIGWIGDIPNDWDVKRIKYAVAEMGSGTTPSSDNSHFYGGDIPWIQSGDLYNTPLITKTSKTVTEQAFQSCSALKIFHKPYIVIAMYGASVGNVSVSLIDACTNQACCVIKPNANNNLAYLKYWLEICKTDFINKSVGGGQPNISQDKIREQAYICPSLEEQQIIVEYLDSKTASIDSAIQAQKTIVEKLKEYKQAVITEAVTKGLNPDAEMKDSGIEWIGEIPKDWNVLRLKFCLSEPLKYGANESGVEYDSELPRYIRITDINVDGSLKDEGKLSLTDETATDFLLKDGDILFARSGATVGKSFIYRSKYGRSAFAGYLIKASVNNRLIADFLNYITLSYYYDAWKNQIFTQATIQNIGADKYNQLPVILPSKSEQQQIVEYLNSKTATIDKAIEQKNAIIEKLEEYKKSIIYNAVTGKIDCRKDVIPE